MTPNTTCDKSHYEGSNRVPCENEAEFDSIYCGGGKLCVKHAQIEADELAHIS